MAVTIQDVAKRAGVSHTTVSWVIHNDPRITQATKDKVLKAIRELDYHPNLHARSLVQGKTNTIAIVAGVFSTSFEVLALKGMETFSMPENLPYNLVLYSLMGKMDSKDKVLKDILFGSSADAVILVNLRVDKEIVSSFSSQEIPLILVEEEGENTHVLKTDNRGGAEQAVLHLIHQGRKEIALVVSDPEDPHCNLSPRERILGYKEALHKEGLPFHEKNLFLTENYYFEDGAEVYRCLMEQNPRIDGIFCASGDSLAAGIMQEALNQGKRIPEELGIIGYDNIDLSSLTSPSLSTVDQPIEEMGREALQLAIACLEGEQKIQRKIFPPNLILRESC